MALSGVESLGSKGNEEGKAKKADSGKKPMTKEEKIQALKDKEKQIKARIAKLQAGDKAKERKQDARRKIILGGVLLNLIKNDEALKAKAKAELDKIAAKDKELFADFELMK
jgi:hypothetical protein